MPTVLLKITQETIFLRQVQSLRARLSNNTQKERTDFKDNRQFRLRHFTGEGSSVLKHSYHSKDILNKTNECRVEERLYCGLSER